MRIEIIYRGFVLQGEETFEAKKCFALEGLFQIELKHEKKTVAIPIQNIVRIEMDRGI